MAADDVKTGGEGGGRAHEGGRRRRWPRDQVQEPAPAPLRAGRAARGCGRVTLTRQEAARECPAGCPPALSDCAERGARSEGPGVGSSPEAAVRACLKGCAGQSRWSRALGAGNLAPRRRHSPDGRSEGCVGDQGDGRGAWAPPDGEASQRPASGSGTGTMTSTEAARRQPRSVQAVRCSVWPR